MKRLFYLFACLPLFAVAACSKPPPICDRDAQVWNKYGTVDDACAAPPARQAAIPATHDDDRDPPTRTPNPPHEPPTQEPPSEPPTPEPPKKPKPPRGEDCDDDPRAGDRDHGKRHGRHRGRRGR